MRCGVCEETGKGGGNRWRRTTLHKVIHKERNNTIGLGQGDGCGRNSVKVD